MGPIEIRGAGLSIADVVAVARHDATVTLADSAREEMIRSAALVDGFIAGDRPVYGVTTGFGSLADTVIPHDADPRAPGRTHPIACGRDG